MGHQACPDDAEQPDLSPKSRRARAAALGKMRDLAAIVRREQPGE